MRTLNGFTFGFCCKRDFTQKDEWKTSLRLMKQETGCDTVVIAVAALQDHAYSTRVDWTTPDVMSMEDVRRVCAYARELGLRIVLKAMVNCRDGYWRAYIHFFDHAAPCEPTWQEWFDSYTAFVCALADTARECGADMLCVGCEMVGTDHRADEWRSLIAQVRPRFSGLITYNCDKYQEDAVDWWDAVDVISSSGYYPMDKLDENFARIERVAQRFERPFLFMECGCPSREGSQYLPNDWRLGGEQSNAAQEKWYQAFTSAVLRHPFVRGTVWWDWSATRLCPLEKADTDSGYGVYGKPACRVLRDFSTAFANR